MSVGPVERQVAGNVACMRCGYPLRGLARDGDCPECGHSIDESAVAVEIAGSSRSDASFSASTSYVGSGVVVLVPISIAAVTLSLGLDVGIALGCLVPFALFLHLCLLMASSLSLSSDPLGEGQSVAERLVGGLGVALLISSLIAPVVLSAGGVPAVRSLDALAPCLGIGWCALYITVHGLSATLFAATAERCAVGTLEKPLARCAGAFFISAIGAGLVLGLTVVSFAIPPDSLFGSSIETLAIAMGVLSAAIHVVAQASTGVLVARLRGHLRRARRMTPQRADGPSEDVARG